MKMRLVSVFLVVCFLPFLFCSEQGDGGWPQASWNRYLESIEYYRRNGAFPSSIGRQESLEERLLSELSRNQPAATPALPRPPNLPDFNVTIPRFLCFDYNLTEINFTCANPGRSNPRPTSVHALRPGDIDVIAATGDSISAGNGAKADCLLEVPIMHRERVFSIGGDDSLQNGSLTLPNILRQYNPNLTGYSVGPGTVSMIERSRLNVAVPGARARDMFEQTEEMIRRMKNMTDVDYDNDWKMVTLFIGGNDLCACNDLSADAFAANIKEALDLMHSEMPRTFVNLVQVLLVTEVNKLTTPDCHISHGIFCPCAKEFYNTDWPDILQLTKDYHRAVEDLIVYGQYDTRDDFTVVIQPFFEELQIKENDHNLLSPDCFHLSEYGHQVSAMSLWNNLIEPVGQKRRAWNYGDVLECPTSEYLYTYLNSPGYDVPTRGPSTPAPPTPEPEVYNFSCPYLPPSNTVPTSVHELRPGDVTVIAALGDSLTAGYGITADTLIETSIQERGLSWSVGGDNSFAEGSLTLTNILRNYNPDIVGYSVDAGSHTNFNISRLNVAVGGARADDMLTQTEELIQRMKTWDKVDYENDWKVVTLFIGGNDLCAYCNDPDGASAKAYRDEIKKALDKMHAEMPRTFVNLVQVLLVTEINKLSGYCDFIHLLACRCAKQRWDENWEDVLHLAGDYHRALEDLVLYGDYDTRDDFTVVIQPFFEETYIPWLEDKQRWDDSLFAPDCFHFSEYGHQVGAISLWNNMIEPAGGKRTAWLPEDVLECPKETFPYFYTYKNTPGYETPTRGPSTISPPETPTNIATTVPPTDPPTYPYKFACEITPPSDQVPTSVHRLRPADVNVIAALGDSITAANGAGADNIVQVAIQYRGMSWSIGGDSSLEAGVLTLSNILRMYNPNLKGYSIETGRDSEIEKSRLNVAVPGARARHMLEQTQELITRMKDWEEVDYDNDWKVVTIFIGGNDLCACSNYSAEEYTLEIVKALDLMHAQMPRTFVNLAQVVLVTEINKLDGYCDAMHLAYCPCAKERFNDNWEDVTDLSREYHRALDDLVASGKYDTRDDFTVVLQPFFQETQVPPSEDGDGWDDSMFSPDCFHFSEYGHQLCALSLWNNMNEPVGEKRTGWHPNDTLECPPEGFEFLYTNLNSPRYTPTTASQTTHKWTTTTVLPTVRDEPIGAQPVCDDYTAALITSFVVSTLLLIACLCCIIYLIRQVSRLLRKSNSIF